MPLGPPLAGVFQEMHRISMQEHTHSIVDTTLAIILQSFHRNERTEFTKLSYDIKTSGDFDATDESPSAAWTQAPTHQAHYLHVICKRHHNLPSYTSIYTRNALNYSDYAIVIR